MIYVQVLKRVQFFPKLLAWVRKILIKLVLIYYFYVKNLYALLVMLGFFVTLTPYDPKVFCGASEMSIEKLVGLCVTVWLL